MIILAIKQDLLGELGIIMNFKDQMVTWDIDTIPMEDRVTSSLSSSIEALWLTFCLHKSANEPQTLRDEYS
jgi:hypothetical protein